MQLVPFKMGRGEEEGETKEKENYKYLIFTNTEVTW